MSGRQYLPYGCTVQYCIAPVCAVRNLIAGARRTASDRRRAADGERDTLDTEILLLRGLSGQWAHATGGHSHIGFGFQFWTSVGIRPRLGLRFGLGLGFGSGLSFVVIPLLHIVTANARTGARGAASLDTASAWPRASWREHTSQWRCRWHRLRRRRPRRRRLPAAPRSASQSLDSEANGFCSRCCFDYGSWGRRQTIKASHGPSPTPRASLSLRPRGSGPCHVHTISRPYLCCMRKRRSPTALLPPHGPRWRERSHT